MDVTVTTELDDLGNLRLRAVVLVDPGKVGKDTDLFREGEPEELGRVLNTFHQIERSLGTVCQRDLEDLGFFVKSA